MRAEGAGVVVDIRTEDRDPVLKQQADKGGVRHTEPG